MGFGDLTYRNPEVFDQHCSEKHSGVKFFTPECLAEFDKLFFSLFHLNERNLHSKNKTSDLRENILSSGSTQLF